jgi:hypothetical protein
MCDYKSVITIIIAVIIVGLAGWQAILDPNADVHHTHGPRQKSRPVVIDHAENVAATKV